MLDEDSEIMAAEEILNLSKSNISFGLDLFKKLVADGKEENIFFSPYSISSALAMTSLGAKGETLEQLRKALKIDVIPEEQVHKMFSELNRLILDNTKKCTLHVANRLYGEKSYNFLDEFLGDCKKFYQAELAAVDFKGNTASCEKEINDWVSRQTKKKIKDLIQSGTLDATTKLILINAIYFKGDWNKKFESSQTKKCDFYITNNHSVRVKMMHMEKAKLNYGVHDKLHCQILELPYAGNSISMFILLPNLKNTTLKELERSLTSEDLNKLHVWKREVNVWLPRFKVEQKFDLSRCLTEMGAEDAFVGHKANFSGMSGNRDLYISKVLHKAFIEVNEEGSEAAAATAIVMVCYCAALPSEPPMEFRADHPFIFFLKDNNTNSILFYGRLVQP